MLAPFPNKPTRPRTTPRKTTKDLTMDTNTTPIHLVALGGHAVPLQSITSPNWLAPTVTEKDALRAILSPTAAAGPLAGPP